MKKSGQAKIFFFPQKKLVHIFTIDFGRTKILPEQKLLK